MFLQCLRDFPVGGAVVEVNYFPFRKIAKQKTENYRLAELTTMKWTTWEPVCRCYSEERLSLQSKRIRLSEGHGAFLQFVW